LWWGFKKGGPKGQGCFPRGPKNKTQRCPFPWERGGLGVWREGKAPREVLGGGARGVPFWVGRRRGFLAFPNFWRIPLEEKLFWAPLGNTNLGGTGVLAFGGGLKPFPKLGPGLWEPGNSRKGATGPPEFKGTPPKGLGPKKATEKARANLGPESPGGTGG